MRLAIRWIYLTKLIYWNIDSLCIMRRVWNITLKTTLRWCSMYVVLSRICMYFLHSGRRPMGARRPSAGCPECICNRPRPWRRPCVSDWGCRAVILLSRGEFGREKNKICYQRGCVWTFCYMPNLWYNIVILQHIFILRNNRSERSYFVFNLGSFARNRECETQVCVFFLNIC